MDPILYWNQVALETNRVSHTNGKKEQTGPMLSARALAIVHLAMYDAFVGTDPGNVQAHYLPGLPAADPAASAEAAVAAAAHLTLRKLFPSQRPYFDGKLADANLPAMGQAEGTAFGTLVGQAILADRQGDPDGGDFGYEVPAKREGHRPDPDDPGQGHHGPFYGTCRLFSATAPHEILPYPAIDTKTYVDAVREVRAKGIAPELMGTVPSDQRRKPEETTIGLYWAYDGASGLGTPPRLYNQIVREVATKHQPVNDAAKNARLFALVNVAMADAGILAWREKYRHNLWRPVNGVREHDDSMGPVGTGQSSFDGDCDPSWLPFGAPSSNSPGKKNTTPPFPAYPSGHATFGAASLQVTRLFYDGDDALQNKADDLFEGLTFVSEELNGMTTDNKGTVRPRHVRSFDKGLWQMIEENGRSRVYLGVHWVFDAFSVKNNGQADVTKNIGGVPLGLAIAKDIYQSGMTKSSVVPPPF